MTHRGPFQPLLFCDSVILFTLGIKKNFLSERVVRHWNKLPRAVGESPSLEGFRKHVDVTLQDMV